MNGLAALRAGLGDIPCSDEGAELEARSRDYYWYSPILKAQLDDKRADLTSSSFFCRLCASALATSSSSPTNSSYVSANRTGSR